MTTTYGGRLRPAGAPRTGSLGRPPFVLLAPAALAAALLVVPLLTLVLDTPWHDFFSQLTSTPVLQALWLTALASLVTSVSSLVWALRRKR